jgi:23S rRNA (cytidine1920-2'-O)/16S rRNA (cytidine1409-2'-O)-methyltransferase
VIEKVIRYQVANGLYPQGLDFSPMTGAKGNIEYLLLLDKNNNETDYKPIIDAVVKASHEELD